MRFYLSFFLVLLSLPASAQRLLLVSGNAQLLPSGFLASKPLVVRAVNANGQGVANVPIQWSGPGLGLASQVTDGDGFAAAAVGGIQLFQRESSVTNKITATADQYGSVEFIETTFNTSTVNGTFVGHPQLEMIPPTQNLTGPPGTIIPRAFGVRVIAQGGLQIGSAIPNVGVRVHDKQLENDPTASCQGANGQAITDAKGEAYCDLVLGSTPAVGFIRANVGEDLISPIIPLTITEGPPCTYGVSPASQAFGGAAASGTITVTAGQGCSWTASTTTSWITINSGASGQANGTVGYSVAVNTGGARSGSIQIADKSIPVTQAAAGSGGTGAITFTSTSPIPAPTVGSPYTYQFGITGGTGPYTWTAAGTFPPGLGLDPNTGGVTGTPTTVGTFNFTITVRDALGVSATAPFVATVAAAGTSTLQITTTAIANGTLGTAYSQAITATGACSSNPFSGGVVNWSVSAGALPPGLTLGASGATTTLSGTPSQVGTFTFTAQAVDSCQRVASRSFTTTVATTSTPNSMVVTPSSVEISVAYTAAASPVQQVTVQTGGTPVAYTVTTSTPWLNFSKTQGNTPDVFDLRAVNIASFAPGQYTGAFTVTSGASNSQVTVPVTLRVSSPANVTVGQESFLFQHTLASPLSQQILNVNSVVAGGRTPFTLEWEADGGGGWLQLNPTVSETPARISVIVDTARLGVGTYRGTIRVRPTGNAGGTIVIPVTAVVTPVSTLAVAQRQLTFAGPGTQQIAVTSTGTALGFTAQTNGVPWLSVTPASATTPGFVNISANAAGLGIGTYQGAILITPNNNSDPIQIGVTLNVTAVQPTITAVTNAASFAPGSVAPGELVTIFGNNIGPTQLVSSSYDSGGTLPTAVANVQVLFDNVPAPLIYAAAGQVSAIVPFGVFGRTTTRVQVVYNGASSNTQDVNVVDAAPGIFVLDASGQGAILNQDNTVNSRVNGGEPGSIIAIYATGAGRMEDALVDGRIVTGIPKPLLPVGVRIGGRVADVLYAGAAPGLVAGMVQVNARIPGDTPRGTTIPVQIIVGNATSQTNVFVATRP